MNDPIDPRLVRMLLDRIPLRALEEFAAPRVAFGKKKPKKRDLVKVFTEHIQLTQEDYEELEALVTGNPTDRGFSVFLYKLADLPETSKLLERISADPRCTLISTHSTTDPQVTLDYEFQENALIMGEDGHFRLGVQQRRARLKLYPSEERAEVFVGSTQRAQRVTDEVGFALSISFQKLVRYDLTGFQVGSLDPMTVFFLELLYNRLNVDGMVENVEKVMFDSTAVEENVENHIIKGQHILDAPSACKLLLEGQRVEGVRFFYRTRIGTRMVATHVTLILNDAGLKIVIAQQNYPPEIVALLFDIVRRHYETLVLNGDLHVDQLRERYNHIRQVAG